MCHSETHVSLISQIKNLMKIPIIRYFCFFEIGGISTNWLLSGLRSRQDLQDNQSSCRLQQKDPACIPFDFASHQF